MKKILTAAVLATLAAAASSSAQVTPGSTDLFLGFQQPNTDGVSGGSNFNYVVDIGPASTYTNATSSFTIGTYGADLSNSGVFGSGWYTNPNTLAAVVGAGSGSGQFFYSLPVSLGTPSEISASAGRSVVGDINSLSAQVASYSSAFGGSNTTGYSSISGAVIEGKADPSSWSSFNPPAATASFAAISNDIEGAPDVAFALYYSVPSSANPKPAASLIGDITIGSAGNVVFTPVPEPSSLAILGGGIAMLGLVRRRRA
jgi:hypothetical protein